jgi:hypothetical protein
MKLLSLSLSKLVTIQHQSACKKLEIFSNEHLAESFRNLKTGDFSEWIIFPTCLLLNSYPSFSFAGCLFTAYYTFLQFGLGSLKETVSFSYNNPT